MSQSIRTRVLRIPKREQEVHVITNPADRETTGKRVRRLFRGQSSAPKSPSSLRPRLTEPDYEAPLTRGSLRPNSGWLIVRRNLHRIRFIGLNERARDGSLPKLYLGLQMKRELKRAQEEIQNIDKEKNFHVVKQFILALDENRTKTYDTSRVKANDALTYDRLGDEPLALQNLLYYFSREPVPHGTLFWDFLNEVNHVLDMKRKRSVRTERLRKLALTLSIIFYTIVGLMLFLLIISVITTATKMDDPQVKWIEPNADTYSGNLVSIL